MKRRKLSLDARYCKAIGQDGKTLFSSEEMSLTLNPEFAAFVARYHATYQRRPWETYIQRFADGSTYVGISSTSHRPRHFRPEKHNKDWNRCQRRFGNPQVIFLFKGRRKESAELEKALIGYYRCQGVCLNVLDGGDAPAATTAVKVSITLRKLGGRRRKVTAVITKVQPELL